LDQPAAPAAETQTQEPTMFITTTRLIRASSLSAVAAGLLFLGVQINHPQLNADFVTTSEWSVRQSMKVLMSGLSLAGVTGMYLRQVKQSGLLGLLGYVVLGIGYLIMMSVEVVMALPPGRDKRTGCSQLQRGL
jgi:hypothetical protein